MVQRIRKFSVFYQPFLTSVDFLEDRLHKKATGKRNPSAANPSEQRSPKQCSKSRPFGSGPGRIRPKIAPTWAGPTQPENSSGAGRADSQKKNKFEVKSP